MSKEYPLNVPAPHHFTFAVRDIPNVTVEQRERVLKATHYNEFAFPAGMLTVDMLSDSGTTAMTNQQWAALFLGDEAYGRNTGYYVLLDTFRDIFERGGEKNWKKAIDLVRTDCRDVEKMMDELYLCEYEGGLFNGGAAQMERPNTFIIQQGRAAESVLMEIVKKILAARHPGKVFTIPSNGHFDTTEGNIKQMGSIPRNLYHKELLYQVPEGGKYEKNPFKGNMDIEKLEQLITAVGPENVPLIFTCITNNPICGQPVSMGNIREINRVAHKYNIPLIFDVARWAENCYFIKMNEEGYADKSIAEIATEMFSYCDGFCMSAKKDGHANMGGMMAFRDKGLFWQNFSDFNEDGTVKTDVGVLLKVKQISCYGNDSYGGMSGRGDHRCHRRHHRPDDPALDFPVDGRCLHLHLPAGRPAGRHHVLLGHEEGYRSGGGPRGTHRRQEEYWRLVLSSGQMDLLCGLSGGSDSGRHLWRHRLIQKWTGS